MKDTHFSSAEIKTLYRAFKDTSPTALIDRDTVREVFIDMFPHGDTEHYADLIFNTFDIEQNGVITFHVFFVEKQ
jgi:neuronal calcium sensor 1